MAVEYTGTFDEILNDTIPQTPGIIRSIALRELRLACREFFEKSYAWTVLVPAIDVTTGNTPIQIDDGDANTEIIGILNLAFNGKDLPSIGRRPSRQLGTSDVPVGYYVTSNPDEFSVYPSLETNQTGAAEALVALMPAFDTDVLPRQIMLKYYDAIISGYLARVYIHPNKPYSAPMLSGQQRGVFLKAVGYYAAQRKQGWNGSQQWNYPAGWGVQRLGGNG